jgi:hypothetical protein
VVARLDVGDARRVVGQLNRLVQAPQQLEPVPAVNCECRRRLKGLYLGQDTRLERLGALAICRVCVDVEVGDLRYVGLPGLLPQRALREVPLTQV